MKLAEELGIPVPALNNVRANKYSILQQGGSSEPSRKKFKTYRYEKLKQYC
jgi:hypothetical protein